MKDYLSGAERYLKVILPLKMTVLHTAWGFTVPVTYTYQTVAACFD